jgi:hypothetical protein
LRDVTETLTSLAGNSSPVRPCNEVQTHGQSGNAPCLAPSDATHFKIIAVAIAAALVAMNAGTSSSSWHQPSAWFENAGKAA